MRALTIIISLLLFLSLALMSTRVFAQPRVTVSTDPIAAIYGSYTGSLGYVVSSRAAIRLDGEVDEGTPLLLDSGGWRLGVSLPIYFDRALHGPFIEPGLVLANRLVGYDVTETMDPATPIYSAIHEQTVGPQIFVGWQWLFESGLTIAGAIGASRNVPASGSGTSLPLPESYLRVGYAF